MQCEIVLYFSSYLYLLFLLYFSVNEVVDLSLTHCFGKLSGCQSSSMHVRRHSSSLKQCPAMFGTSAQNYDEGTHLHGFEDANSAGHVI